MEGMGYNRTMYPNDWKKLSRDLGRPELVENAQMKKLTLVSIWGQFLTFCSYSQSPTKNGQIRRKTLENRNLTV